MSSRMEIDAQPVLDQIDRIEGGIIPSFFKTATGALKPISERARGLWPVLSGTSRDSIRVEAGQSKFGPWVGIVAGHTGFNNWPAYKVTWTSFPPRTREQIEERDKRREEFVERVGQKQYTSSDARQRAIDFWHTIWPRTQPDWKRGTGHSYGSLPPSPDMMGKQPWRYLILNPGKAAAVGVADELRDDLTLLATGRR